MRYVSLLVGMLLTAPVTSHADLSVLLTDGKTLESVQLEVEDGLYLLELDSGAVVSIPVGLVSKITYRPRIDPLTGIDFGRRPETLAGLTETGPAVRTSEPDWVGGDPIAIPGPVEMLRNLPQPARFRPDLFDPTYTPVSDWNFSNPERSNSWRPARWSDGVIEPRFILRNYRNLDPEAGNNWAPSRWRRAPIDPVWIPQDSFGGITR